MKIVLSNTVALNTGDAAILKGIIKIVNYRFGDNCEFIIYDLQPKIAKRYYPGLQFKKSIYFQTITKLRSLGRQKILQDLNKKRLLRGASYWKSKSYTLARLILTPTEIQVLKDYESADIIISTGGTYLVENYNLEPRIIDFLISIILNENIVLFTQSLGPFVKPENIEAFKYIFSQAKFIFLRDSISRRNIENMIDSQTKVSLFADAAFALADLVLIRELTPKYTLPVQLHVAISVRYWPHFKDINPELGQNNYLNSVRELSIFLVRKLGCKVTYISTCQGITEYYLDDSEVAASIHRDLPSDVRSSISIERNHYSPEELMEVLKHFDFTIATRLHMAILSMCVGVPVIPIAYEFKSIELFEKIGLGKWVANIENLSSDQLISLVVEFKDQLVNIRQQVAAAVEKEFSSAMESGAVLQSLIK